MAKQGCGTCGKPRPGPYGHPSNSKPTPSTSMGAQTQSFQLEMNSGEKLVVTGSRLEARATLARLGGRGKIT